MRGENGDPALLPAAKEKLSEMVFVMNSNREPFMVYNENEQQLLLRLSSIFLEYMCCSVSITGGDGRFILANKECERNYGFLTRRYAGKPVTLMEEQSIFKPSIALMVLKTKARVTEVQPDIYGVMKPTTGVPVFDSDGNISFVVCFASWDFQTFDQLQNKYRQLEERFHQCAEEMRVLKEKSATVPTVGSNNRQMAALAATLSKIAPYDACVLFKGEPGVGKSFYARHLHNLRHKTRAPFIEINCAVIPPDLMEEELFGTSRKQESSASPGGALGRASHGTLLLEEIDALPLKVQSHLVSAMQRKERDSGNQVGPRLMATTGKDLAGLVAEGSFREELYYLLNTIPLTIPPLRERPEDIVSFAAHFLDKKNREYGLDKSLSQQAMNRLLAHKWPGNIREMQSLIERLLLTTTEDVIQTHHLPDTIGGLWNNPEDSGRFTLKEAMEFHEKRLVLQAYEKHKTTVALARALGISQPSAVRKLAKYRPSSP